VGCGRWGVGGGVWAVAGAVRGREELWEEIEEERK
jgi:hypothetical protein